MRVSYSKVSDLGQGAQLLWFQPVLQYALNMQSEASSWESIATLSEEIMDEDL
jgi:hypothetical protein